MVDSTSCFPCSVFAFIYFSPWSSIVFACFSKAFSKGEQVNLIFYDYHSIFLLLSEDNIFSPVRYSDLSIFADDNADIVVFHL